MTGMAMMLAATALVSAGESWFAFDTPRVMNFCGAQEVTVFAGFYVIGEADDDEVVIDLVDNGIPSNSDCTISLVPAHSFLDPNPASISTFSCNGVRILIPRPSELDTHAAVCTSVRAAYGGGTISHGLELINSIAPCIKWPVEEGFFDVQPFDPIVLDPVLRNGLAEGLVVDYSIQAFDSRTGEPDASIVAFNDSAPGKPVLGRATIPPQGSEEIPLRARWVDESASGFVQIVINGTSGPSRVGGRERRAPSDMSAFLLRRSPRDPVAVGNASPPAARIRLVPNPLRAGRSLLLHLPASLLARAMTVYDATGRVVRRLDAAGGGTGVRSWDGTDATGRAVPAGTYFIRIDAEEGPMTERFVILR